jgi:CRISPR-associated protein Csb1
MTSRRGYDAQLTPVLGSTFQPTGFPDIGAATFTRFENGSAIDALLVESVQSMANRLEATAWDQAADAPAAEVTGLPYVRVVRAGTGEFLTSSRLEAHRLASPFVHKATLDGRPMFDVIRERLGLAKDTPLRRAAMARAVAGLDPFCLLHGVFFAQKEWYGQPKFERAVSAVIEAHGVRRAVSGGRKSDRVRHQLDESEGGTAEGYGSVPFHRTEWTARTIVASFVVDVELLRSYGLPVPVTELLETLALWEIRCLLDGALRLRTACDLELAGPICPRWSGPELPKKDELGARLAGLLPQCGDVFGSGGPLTVEWSAKAAKKSGS